MRKCAMFLSAVMLLITLIVLTAGSPREDVHTSVSAHSLVKRESSYIDVTRYGPDWKDTNNECQNIRIDCDFCDVTSAYQVPVGKIIRASFGVLKRGEVPEKNQCSHTWMKVYDGRDNTTEIASACGNEVPATLKTTGDAMTVQIRSQEHRRHPVYNITECFVDAAPRPGDTWCSGEWDGNLTSSPGTIQSANYPGNYPDRHICNWNITAPKDRKIKFTFLGVFGIKNTVNDRDCLWEDKLEFRDGGQLVHGPDKVKKICGEQKDQPSSFTSKTNVVFIRFVTDGSATASGFQLKYEFVEGSAAGLWSSAVLLFLSVAASASFGRSV